MADKRSPASDGPQGVETTPLGDRDPRRRPDAGLSLVVLGRGIDRTIALPPSGSVILGRGEDADVRLDDPSVSRRHARLDLGPPLRCTDLGAKNPVRVRGRPLAPDVPVEIAPGEVIDVGRLLVLVRAGGPPAPAAEWRPPTHAGSEVVIEDPAMRSLYQLVQRLAAGDVPILILGETGVGKEVIAEALHGWSPRADGPFVKLNCAALPAGLLESELFGHEAGAFTGAARRQVGLIETAHGGTLFLDEIGEMSLPLQASLLRVVEDREILTVGGRKPRRVDVRFVAATNRDLRAEVERGTFRKDLFYRLSGASFTVPPLRQRPGDVEPLSRIFAARARPGGRPAALAPDALARLRAYHWPGNVRELRHVIAVAALLAGDEAIGAEHLPEEMRAASPAPSRAAAASSDALREEIAGVERKRIIQALHTCGGNQTRAAELLGIPRRTLVRRIREYDIPRGRVVPPSDD